MAEQPSIEVLVERITNVQTTVGEIKTDMATKVDQQNTHSVIGRVEVALAAEVTARTTAVKEVRDRLQVLEDKLEARKYQFGIAIAIGVISAFVSPIIGSVVTK